MFLMIAQRIAGTLCVIDHMFSGVKVAVVGRVVRVNTRVGVV